MAKKTNYYFESFMKMVDYSCLAADYLVKMLTDFSRDSLGDYRRTMHRIEHEEDQLLLEVMEELAKEFLPPIDREDIISIVNTLDNVTDKIEDILIHIYMYNINQIRPEAFALAEVIQKSCSSLKAAMEEFTDSQRYSPKLKEAFRQVSLLEEDGDLLYINAMHKLYNESKDTLEIMIWSELFESFEDVCDACEVVISDMQMVVMKNS